MQRDLISFVRCYILGLAGWAACTALSPVNAFGDEQGTQPAAPPKIDHILLEVANLKASIAFYRDFLGLRLKSQSDWFVMLESGNVGVFLRNSRWDWEKSRSSGEQPGVGMYPHFQVNDAAAMVEKARRAGYHVVQEPRNYDFGTEAFMPARSVAGSDKKRSLTIGVVWFGKFQQRQKRNHFVSRFRLNRLLSHSYLRLCPRP